MKTKILLWTLVLLIMSVGAAAAITTDLEAYYLMENTSTTGFNPLYDQSGNDNNLTNYGAVFQTNNLDGYLYDGINDYADTGFVPASADISVCSWVNTTNTNKYSVIGGMNTADKLKLVIDSRTGQENWIVLLFQASNVEAVAAFADTTCNPEHNWCHMCMVFNDTSNDLSLYVNGIREANITYTGSTNYGANLLVGSDAPSNNNGQALIKNFAVWSRVLTVTEINETYSEGRNYNPFLSVANFSITASNNYGETLTTFNATISGTTYNTTNGTINTDIPSNSTSLYNITVSAPSHDARTYLNQNVSLDLAAVLNFSYYKLNITVNLYNGSSIQNFNATVSSTEYTTSNGFITLNLTKGATYEVLVDPTGYTTNTTNVTMSDWITNHTVTVYPTNTLNLSFYDEQTSSLLTLNVSYSLIVDDTNATSGTTVTGTAWEENLAAGSYEIRYSATDHDERSYFFTLTDRNYYELSLYLINNTVVEDITNILRDEYGNLLEGYIIKLLRYYPALSAFLVVDEGKTNFEGETILQAARNSYYYKFRITDENGTVIKTTGSTQIYDTTINHYVTLGAGVGTALERLGDLSYSLAFLNATDTFRFVFDHSSGTVVSASLYVYELDDTGETLINSSTLASGSGTIYVGLTPTNETSYVAKAYVTYSGDTDETYVTSLTYTNDDILNIFGQYGVFLTLIICLILVFIGRFNPSVAVIHLPVALIITRIAQLHVLAWTHITAITALGFVVIYAIHKIS